MSNQFNWKIDEEANEAASQPRRSRWPVGGIFFLILSAAVIGALLGGWALKREQDRENRQQLVDETQELLDLGQQASLNGDAEL